MISNPTRLGGGLVAASIATFLLWTLWPTSEGTHKSGERALKHSNSTDPKPIEPLRTTSEGSTPADAAKAPKASPLTDEEIEALGAQLRDGKDEDAKQRAFKKLMAGMTSQNAAKIQKQIEHLSPHSPESRLFYNTWGRMDGEPVMAIAAWESRQSAEAALAGWASANPAAARSYFDGLQPNSHNGDGSTNHLSQEYLRLGLVQGLADADPDMATQFVQEQFEAGDVGDKRAGDMIRAVAHSFIEQRNIDEAKNWALSVPNDLRNEAIAGVAREFAASDIEATLEWLGSLGEEHHQGAAYFHTFTTWMKDDPTAASEYLATMPDSYQRNEAIVATALQTIGEDWASPLDLIDTIPEQASRNRGYSDTFNSWARRDAVAASDYLTEMSQSTERDHAINGFASSLVVRDPASAIAWADQIEDAKLRESSLVTVGLSYFENDPTGATEWLPESGLSVETVETILNPSAENRHLLNFLTQQ